MRDIFVTFVSGLAFIFLSGVSGGGGGDAPVMLALRDGLKPPVSLGWSDTDPCKWDHVGCSDDGRVTRIQIGHQNLGGSLPENLRNLTELKRLELQFNAISGPLPSLNGLGSLQVLLLGHNNFTSVPGDFFSGMTSLQSVELDNNPFSPWEIPESLRTSPALQNFSANSANLAGAIPEFLGSDEFPSLINLHLAFNTLQGGLPETLTGSQIRSLWVNGQNLAGDIHVIGNMTALQEVWLHSNYFSGPLPDFSGLKSLETLNLRDNQLTGPIPYTLVNLQSLKIVSLTNNLFQGQVPEFKPSVTVDTEMSIESNRFCLPKPGHCDPKVYTLLLISKSMNYPQKFADSWRGNDPCADWIGITCNNGNITVVNFENMGLAGSISPEFASLKSLQRLLLAKNNLTGSIPDELTTLPDLSVLDVTNNQLSGKIPIFRTNLIVKTTGNPDLGKDKSSNSSRGSSNEPSSNHGRRKSTTLVVIIVVVAIVAMLCVGGLIAFFLYKNKQKHIQSQNATVIHPRSDNDNNIIKVTVAGSSITSSSIISESHTIPTTENREIQTIESGNMIISIQVLKTATNNFNEANVLGSGGFGTVYKGKLPNGTTIAVKRMESNIIKNKGLSEFKSEIDVLTKVRHRHLVALLGFCLDENEKLLVYEYMPRGTLSGYIFNWGEEGLEPLDWRRRVSIALDVARGVEYLHSLAHQSFIHRDLKPSNILLGDDMRAKVADFGLVRLAPEGKASIHTTIAGTFGYLAPEYAVTGRVTTKIDVFSFGVILMELITGRKALDQSQPEESIHLVTWFKRALINKDSFPKAIDPTLHLNDDALASIATVAELAGHCCARDPHQRPDMGHAVNVLSSLAELWKPTEHCVEDLCGDDDLEMSLPEVLKRWQAYDGRSDMESSSSSSVIRSLENTQTSIPTRLYGFAESFCSADGR